MALEAVSVYGPTPPAPGRVTTEVTLSISSDDGPLFEVLDDKKHMLEFQVKDGHIHEHGFECDGFIHLVTTKSVIQSPQTGHELMTLYSRTPIFHPSLGPPRPFPRETGFMSSSSLTSLSFESTSSWDTHCTGYETTLVNAERFPLLHTLDGDSDPTSLETSTATPASIASGLAADFGGMISSILPMTGFKLRRVNTEKNRQCSYLKANSALCLNILAKDVLVEMQKLNEIRAEQILRLVQARDVRFIPSSKILKAARESPSPPTPIASPASPAPSMEGQGSPKASSSQTSSNKSTDEASAGGDTSLLLNNVSLALAVDQYQKASPVIHGAGVSQGSHDPNHGHSVRASRPIELHMEQRVRNSLMIEALNDLPIQSIAKRPQVSLNPSSLPAVRTEQRGVIEYMETPTARLERIMNESIEVLGVIHERPKSESSELDAPLQAPNLVLTRASSKTNRESDEGSSRAVSL
ncbi:hypothetical protein BGW38_007739, partial [Lunasporangiospora selenospora]